MKTLTIALILSMLLFIAVAVAQETATETVHSAQTVTGSTDEQPAENVEDDSPARRDRTLMILGFGLIVIVAEIIMVKFMKARWTPYSVIRMTGLTLIVIAALVLAAGSQERTQISAVIGLLGTLAGYLLGKESREEDVIPKHNDGTEGEPQPAGETTQ